MLTKTPHQMARDLAIERTRSAPMYFVLCDYGPHLGQAFDECDPNESDFDTVVRRLAEEQFTSPLQVIEIDVSKGTSRDVTAEAQIMARQYVERFFR